jgi:hypothetical protein
MTKYINEILEETTEVDIGYSDFWGWYEKNARNFDKLINYTENDNGSSPEYLNEIATKMFLYFQAFYILLRKRNIETISLRRVFFNIGNQLIKFMVPLNGKNTINNLNDLFEIKDKLRESELKTIIQEISEDSYQRSLELEAKREDKKRKGELWDDYYRQIDSYQKHSTKKVASEETINAVARYFAYKFPTANNVCSRYRLTRSIKVGILRRVIRASI